MISLDDSYNDHDVWRAIIALDDQYSVHDIYYEPLYKNYERFMAHGTSFSSHDACHVPRANNHTKIAQCMTSDSRHKNQNAECVTLSSAWGLVLCAELFSYELLSRLRRSSSYAPIIANEESRERSALFLSELYAGVPQILSLLDSTVNLPHIDGAAFVHAPILPQKSRTSR